MSFALCLRGSQTPTSGTNLRHQHQTPTSGTNHSQDRYHRDARSPSQIWLHKIKLTALFNLITRQSPHPLKPKTYPTPLHPPSSPQISASIHQPNQSTHEAKPQNQHSFHISPSQQTSKTLTISGVSESKISNSLERSAQHKT